MTLKLRSSIGENGLYVNYGPTPIYGMPKIAIFWQISWQRLPGSASENFQLAFQVYVTDGVKVDKAYPNQPIVLSGSKFSYIHLVLLIF